MIKKILIGVGILIGILIITIAYGIYYFKPDKNHVLNFLKENPGKSAILLSRNDSILAEQNIYKMMSLASTVKIIVAIEYAEQASAGKIDADELVEISELEKFYVPKTDGGAYSAWKKSINEIISDDKISIHEIAKGMIKYSSNANTEWLMAKLGLEKINARLDSLQVKNHTPIFHLVSSLFVGKEAFPELKGKELAEKVHQMFINDYIAYTQRIHLKLLADSSYKINLAHLDLDYQKAWSDKLPASTVSEYVSIMKKINSREYFNPGTRKYLDDIMEYMLENPANSEWLQHAGMKGGSTAFVLTKVLYTTDKEGNKTELAYFLNDLSILEMFRLQFSLNDFELNILKRNDFRQKVAETISHHQFQQLTP